MKGISIFLVVIGHVLAWVYEDFYKILETPPSPQVTLLWRTIYSFHMPLFIFVSGYLFMSPLKKYTTAYLSKRFISYLIPFITMGLLLYFWRGGKIDNYWYLRTLVELSAILFLINKIKCPPYIVFAIFVIFLFVVCRIIPSGGTIDLIVDKSHLRLFFYFGLGYLYRRYKCLTEKYLMNEYVLFVTFLYFFLSIAFDYQIHLPYLHAIIIIILMVNISDSLASFSCASILDKFGKATLEIYLIHFFFTFRCYDFGNWILSIEDKVTSFLAQFFVSTFLSVGIVYFCIYIAKFLRTKPVISFLLLGDMKIFSKY